jgi:hypothetical protein
MQMLVGVPPAFLPQSMAVAKVLLSLAPSVSAPVPPPKTFPEEVEAFHACNLACKGRLQRPLHMCARLCMHMHDLHIGLRMTLPAKASAS